MQKPYFKGQKPAQCGCYYPDVVQLRDDPRNGERIFHCIIHGAFRVPAASECVLSCEDDLEIPLIEEWREQERIRLRSEG